MRCEARIEYVSSLDGLTCSVPVEMADMAISRIGIEKRKEHDEFILANPGMPAAEIAKALGRTVSAIYTRKAHLRIKARHAEIHAGVGTRSASATADDKIAPLQDQADHFKIEFAGHEQLFARLKDAAIRNFRSPQQQALYFIHQGIQAEDSAGDNRRAPDGAA
jgi:hypothetical protein